MTETQSTTPLYSDEVNLAEVVRALEEGRWSIFILTVIISLSTTFVAMVLPDIYESKALLAPKSNGGDAGLSKLASQYSGLASLAGINLEGLGNEGLSKSSLAQEKIKSLAFFSEHLYEDVVVDLMAVKFWDPTSGGIRYDEDIYDSLNRKWVREVDFPKRIKPSAQESHEKFLEVLSVTEDQASGLIELVVEHESPIVAQYWVQIVLDRVSEELRKNDILEAEESINFLKDQREETSLVSLDEIFAQLIEEQTKTIMLARVSRNYVFDVIDPPVVSEFKSKPQRVLISVLGAILGSVLGVVIVLIRYFTRSK